MPVAIYTRISSDREKTQAGVERQREDCLKLAQAKRLDVVEVIVDNDKSAYRRSKPRAGWEQIKQLVTAGSIDGIVSWHVDRLYRHPADLEDIIEIVERASLTIHTVMTGDLDLNTSSGRLVARLLGAAARHEVELKAERQARKHLAIAQEGRWQGGIVPTGYRRAGKGRLEIDEPIAQAIREAARRILKGHSLMSTVLWYREATDRPNMKPLTLKGILTGPTVAGFRMHVPQSSRDKHNAARARRQVSGDLPKDMGIYKASWEPILDEATWHAVRGLLLDPKRRTAGKRPEKSLLSGLLRCGLCGHRLGYSAQSYSCGRNVGGCGKLGISVKPVERHLLDLVGYALQTNIAQLPAVEPVELLPERDWDGIRAEYLELHTKQILTTSELMDRLAAVDKERGAYEEQREQQIRELGAAGQISTAAEEWEHADKAQQRAAIRALVEEVVVKPSANGRKSGSKFDYDRLDVRWRK
ncbi:resolvase [Paenarthrobacter nicotinovorans]|uniref:recombinase family protein n=1 Tax=Paenarthrobacter nicotinovorans TaxID=29320 RepID=UPI0007CC4112|nr:recombinase family protein [Paenarthrobacter nicotinovorans]GAT86050.1 resolvase [Paenarthrobacter nicotinovorans]